LRIFAGRDDNPGALPAGDQRSLKRDVVHITNVEAGVRGVVRRNRVQRFVLCDRLAGEAALVDGQLVDVEQTQVGRHAVADNQIDLR